MRCPYCDEEREGGLGHHLTTCNKVPTYNPDIFTEETFIGLNTKMEATITNNQPHPMNQMIRHTWTPTQSFDDLTVLICQRKTADVTKLCLESLLNHYPTVSVLIVDGDSQDESSMYLAMKQALYPNVKVHTHQSDRHSHGEIMDFAIRHLITTRHVLLMDSDVITMRAGYIEKMLERLDSGCYAVGTVMEMGIQAEGCGPAIDADDTVWYAHPSLSMINRQRYLNLAPFKDHGAPCISNMIEAKHKGYVVGDIDVENYTLHLSGSSWTTPRTVWWHDNDVMVRPMLSVIGELHDYDNRYNDVEVIPLCKNDKQWDSVITWDMIVASDYNVEEFNTRFNVRGEFVVVGKVTQQDVDQWRTKVLSNKTLGIDGEIYSDNRKFWSRKSWQKYTVSPKPWYEKGSSIDWEKVGINIIKGGEE